ncbi:3-dehydroquinate synthase [Candidatus Hepatincolaceae symbiont of Richtersius coronifer]
MNDSTPAPLVTVNTKQPYNIYTNTTLDRDISNILKLHQISEQVIIIFDSNIPKSLIKKLIIGLQASNYKVHAISIEAKEKNKDCPTTLKLCEKILQFSPKKSHALLAVGGGIIGDIVGFCASILLRGIPFFQIPTTLLAQVDSAIGGKTGVNSSLGKNTIGTFYQPQAVFINQEFLLSLPLREILAGYAECVKYGLIFDDQYFNYLEKNYHNLLGTDKFSYLISIVSRCCEYKAYIIGKDELETKDIRVLLNLGHTFAHAIEAYNNYNKNVIHGEAVGIGMVMAFKFSAFLKLCSHKDYVRVEQHIKNAQLPYKLSQVIKNPNVDRIINLMKNDKKNYSKQMNLILAKGIGKAFFYKNVNINLLQDFLQIEINTNY